MGSDSSRFVPSCVRGVLLLTNLFFQRFYTVFDTTNSRVGFATTEFTEATTN